MLGGSFFDGKGQPSQINAVSHGSPPARFKNINVIMSMEFQKSGMLKDVAYQMRTPDFWNSMDMMTFDVPETRGR